MYLINLMYSITLYQTKLTEVEDEAPAMDVRPTYWAGGAAVSGLRIWYTAVLVAVHLPARR